MDTANTGVILDVHKGQYLDEKREAITRINRIAAFISVLVAVLLMLKADPSNFAREVAIPTIGFDVLPNMKLGRLIGIVASLLSLILALVPRFRRYAIFGGCLLYIGTVIQCTHLSAGMSNYGASVTAWIMLSAVMIAIYPLPLYWTLTLAGLTYVYYFSVYFGLYDGLTLLASVNDPLGPPRLRFMMTMINTAATTILSLAIKIALERIRLREFTSRKGLERANGEIATLNEKLKDENLKMSLELDVARHIQEIVLPPKTEYSAFPDLDIACKMVPATEVGGDYYDTIRVSPHGLFTIGDVTDHGLQSGIVMMMVHTAIRSLSHIISNDLKKIFAVANDIIYEFRTKTDDYRFISLLLLQYTGQGTFKMTGQHESILILRKNGSVEEVSTLELGVYAGLDKNIEHMLHLSEINIEPGESIVLYTDGITEAMNAGQAEFGKEGITAAMLAAQGGGAEQIKESILSRCYTHLSNAPVHDDLSLLVIQRRAL